MASEVVVRPEGRVGPAAAVVIRGGRGAVGGGVGDADDAAEVCRAEPPLLVVVGTVQLPPFVLQARISAMSSILKCHHDGCWLYDP